MVLALMLGVTNHWVSFLAHKHAAGVDFFLLDSRNRDYLRWDEGQMAGFLAEEDRRRVERGEKAFTQFQKDVHLTCMKDIQKIVSLLCSWITGQSTVQEYVVNSRLLVFLRPLMSHLGTPTHEQFLQLALTKETIQ